MNQFLQQGGVKVKSTIKLPLIIWCMMTLFIAMGRAASQEPQDNTDIFQIFAFEDLGEEEMAYAIDVRNEAGVYRDGQLLVVSLGEKPSGGFHVEFVQAERQDDLLKLYVRVIEPKPGDIVTEVLTYPTLVGKVDLPENVSVQVYNADTGEAMLY